MRWFVLLSLLGVLAPQAASAKCASYAETLLTPEVPAGTPLVLFEVYSFDDDEIPSELDVVAGQLTLTTVAGVKVPLSVRATHRGMRQTQLELVPQRPLAVGTYRLVRTLRERAQQQQHTLKVVAAPRQAPLPAPTVLAATSVFQAFGCGPGESIDVTLGAAGPYFAAADSDTPRYAFVTLSDRAGGTERGYLRVGVDGHGLTLAIGHGMCSGEFMPIAQHHYTATIQLVGPDGALGPPTTAELDYAPR